MGVASRSCAVAGAGVCGIRSVAAWDNIVSARHAIFQLPFGSLKGEAVQLLVQEGIVVVR